MIKIKTALILAGIIGILALVPSGILFWELHKLEELNAQRFGQLDIEHRQLTESLQRAETKQATQQDLDTFAAEVDLDIQAVRDDLRQMGATLEAVASTKAQTTTVVHNHYPSDSSTPSETEPVVCPEDGRPIDIHSYTTRVERRELVDSNGMRVADVTFEAAEENPWTDTVWGISYLISNAISRTPDGRIILHTELSATSDAEPDRHFRIEGVESRVLQVPEEAHFEAWDPHVILAIQLGLAVHPGIDFSAAMTGGFTAMSYGDWSFLGLTIGYEPYHNSFFASFIPFMYNAGGPIPVLSDLHIFPWIGIDVGWNANYNVSVGVGIGTRL